MEYFYRALNFNESFSICYEFNTFILWIEKSTTANKHICNQYEKILRKQTNKQNREEEEEKNKKN